MVPNLIDRNTQAIEHTQSAIARAGFLKLCRKRIARNLLSASYLVRFDQMLKGEVRDLQAIEALRQEAEANSDLHDSMARWVCGGHPIYGFPSERFKTLHPQLYYHLSRIRHREQHELWGPSRSWACKEKDRATIAFLNGGGDPEETRYWPPGLEEEFLDSLIWQWKNDTGI